MCLSFPHVQRKAAWSQPYPEKEPGTSRISTRSFTIICGPQRRTQIIDLHQDTGFSRTWAETGTRGTLGATLRGDNARLCRGVHA